MEFIFLDICGLLCYVISCETNVMSLKFRRLCSSSEKRSACLHLLALLHALLKSDSVCEDNYRLGSTLTMEVPVSLKCRYISTRIHGAMQNIYLFSVFIAYSLLPSLLPLSVFVFWFTHIPLSFTAAFLLRRPHFAHYYLPWDVSYSMVRRPRYRVSIPIWYKIHLSSPKRPDPLWIHPASFSLGIWPPFTKG